MKAKLAFREGLKRLLTVYPEGEAISVLKLIFEDLGIGSGLVFMDDDINLEYEQELKYNEYLNRLVNNEPVQYVLGYSWFFERKFNVSPSCLIPRQETELLVDFLIKKFKNHQDINILDIGTGSGCIAVSLQIELPYSTVYASDISIKCIEQAEKNAAIHSQKIKTILDDILMPDYSKYPADLDLVVSNPPYVRSSEKQWMHKNVLDYEPELALFVPDDDPLKYYRAIGDFCYKMLRKNGYIFVEINENFGNELIGLYKNYGFKDLEIIKDIHDKNRFVYGCKE